MSENLPNTANEVNGKTNTDNDNEADFFTDCIEHIDMNDDNDEDENIRTSPVLAMTEQESNKTTNNNVQVDKELLPFPDEQGLVERKESFENIAENTREEDNTQLHLDGSVPELTVDSMLVVQEPQPYSNKTKCLPGIGKTNNEEVEDVVGKEDKTSDLEEDTGLLTTKPQMNTTKSLKQPKEMPCNPCLDSGTFQIATYSCSTCQEVLCDGCAKLHLARKITKSHRLSQLISIKPPCNWCAYLGAEDVTSSYHCDKCDENLCDECFLKHQSQKQTKDHLMTQATPLGNPNINPANSNYSCSDCASNRPAEVICNTCECMLCPECLVSHLKLDSNTEHTIKTMDIEMNKSQTILCIPCEYQHRKTAASSFCIECREYMCRECEDGHSLSTVNHRVIETSCLKYCALCLKRKQQQLSRNVCLDCEKPLPLCDDCSLIHKSLKPSRGHQLEPLNLDNLPTEVFAGGQIEGSEMREREMMTPLTKPRRNNNLSDVTIQNKEQPGQPRLENPKHRSIDSFKLTWDPPKLYYDSYLYQIRYKEADAQEWKFYDKQIAGGCHTATISKLKSNTKYAFQVRMVNNEKEGPYSVLSEVIKTLKSAASRLLDYTSEVEDEKRPISMRKVPFTQILAARNTENKSRRLELGSSNTTTEKTIMLVGATGSGKSTLVDGIANFVLGVNWDDDFRLTATDLEDEEKRCYQNQAVSQTRWITCYTMHPMKGSRIDYTLNIVDTPGFGDTRGIERDQEIVEQIRQLFNDESSKGIAFVDAVCFLVKAPDARLTPSQRYIFDSILSLFGNDIQENICFLITFADGNTPPVLDALKESDLFFEPFFPFNNSGLFADNSPTNTTASLAPMFWEMGTNSFKGFLEHVSKINSKSLLLTKEVLDKRKELEITVEYILPLIDMGLHKIDALSDEMRTILNHERDIEENKNFTYTVKETRQIQSDLPKGEHVTNCLTCHQTCHKLCRIAEDEHKDKCSAMDQGTGMCNQCDCHWTQHKNTPYIFEYNTVNVKRTYSEKLQAYNIAISNKQSKELIMDSMERELEDLESQLQQRLLTVNECTNKLKAIALRPDPLSADQYIDLLIQTEKTNKCEGFVSRVNVLQTMKRKSNVKKQYAFFRERRQRVQRDANEFKKSPSRFERLKKFVWK